MAGGAFGETRHGACAMISRTSRRVSSATLRARRKHKERHRREYHREGEHDDGCARVRVKQACGHAPGQPAAAIAQIEHPEGQVASALWQDDCDQGLQERVLCGVPDPVGSKVSCGLPLIEF